MLVRKMHSCGNDFCLVEYESGIEYSSLAVRICNRRIGIGADGLIVFKKEPLEMLYYNPLGHRIVSNGNALRCLAKYAYSLGYARRGKLEFLAGAKKVMLEVTSQEPFSCSIDLGKPNFSSSMLKVNDDLDCFGRTILIDGHYITIYSLFLGDIHSVVFVDEFSDKILDLAKEISTYKIFAQGTNVDFVKVVGKDKIIVKSYEREIGFVLSQGDGCAAASVVAQKLGYTKTKVKAELELGTLTTEITKKGTVILSGGAVDVFHCEF